MTSVRAGSLNSSGRSADPLSLSLVANLIDNKPRPGPLNF